jgi:carbon storage regulator CsrA
MLVLTRTPQEVVKLTCPDGTVIRVVFVSVDRNKIRLGFDAPPGVQIERMERLEGGGHAHVPSPR